VITLGRSILKAEAGCSTNYAFAETKKQTESVLAELLEIARGVANTNVVNYVQEIMMRFSNEEFCLAVLGLFKRGKSTLINALLSQEILPSGILPLTSIITRVRYGESVSVKIAFEDGSAKDISLSELQNYITENGNPGNIMRVREAEIQVPSRILSNGVVIVDTPGVGSTYLSNTKTTYDFMEKVDAALFVLGVDPPISQQEVEFIKNLRQYAAKIIFVLNKIDYVDEAALKEALGFCEKVVEDSLQIDSITIFPTSAKMALQGRLSMDASVLAISRIDRLEAILQELFSKSKGELILRSTATKALRASTDLSLSVQLEIRTITMPMDELDQALRTFESTLKSIESKKRELFYFLDGEVKEIVKLLDQDLENFKNEHEEHFVSVAEDFAKKSLESRMSQRDIVAKVEEHIQQAIIKTYAPFISSEEEKVESRLQQLALRFSKEIESLVGVAREEASKQFRLRIEVKAPAFSTDLALEHRFYYHFDPFLDTDRILLGEVPVLLPRSLFRGRFLKKVRDRSKQEFDKNGGRIRYDYFITRLDKSVRGFEAELEKVLESSIQNIRDAIEGGERLRQRNSSEVSSTIQNLNRTAERLRTLQGRFETIALFAEPMSGRSINSP